MIPHLFTYYNLYERMSNMDDLKSVSRCGFDIPTCMDKMYSGRSVKIVPVQDKMKSLDNDEELIPGYDLMKGMYNNENIDCDEMYNDKPDIVQLTTKETNRHKDLFYGMLKDPEFTNNSKFRYDMNGINFNRLGKHTFTFSMSACSVYKNITPIVINSRQLIVGSERVVSNKVRFIPIFIYVHNDIIETYHKSGEVFEYNVILNRDGVPCKGTKVNEDSLYTAIRNPIISTIKKYPNGMVELCLAIESTDKMFIM